MPVTVVVGGQFGSEGKGKVAHFLAKEMGARFAVRVGGPNSGHTVIDDFGRAIVFRHLPTACLLPNVVSVIPPGNYLDVRTLLGEIQRIGEDPRQIAVDPYAWVIREEDVRTESQAGLQSAIGSTCTGTGAALLWRISRSGSGTFAKNVAELRPYIRDTTEILAGALRDQQRVIVEGTQGFGLSLLHSGLYPYCTSRDTTAAGVLSEAGLSPLDVDDITLVIRAFPIRVGGNSGPLPGETSWEELTHDSGSDESLVEYTSVTGRVRRVAKFDSVVVQRAILTNRPSRIVLNHVDYIDVSCRSTRTLAPRSRSFVEFVERSINREVDHIGLGPSILITKSNRSKPALAYGI